jgi:uncharacterized protein
MNPKKVKEKERRRARKLADEAWEAANNGDLQLAEKIIRRATATRPDNPVLWNDQGMILALARKDGDAEESFFAALSLAPDFAEAYHHLAALSLRRGWVEKAIRLAGRAVELAPELDAYRERLAEYEQMTGKEHSPEFIVQPAPGAESTLPTATVEDVTARLAELDWHQLGNRLMREGCIVIAELLDAAACAYLRELFDQDPLFAKTVTMDQPDFGRGVYRYFRAPVPELVEGLRRAAFPNVARIANEWQRLLGNADRFPEVWDEFRAECHAAGQTTPTPILLKYGPGGFNALHRDLRGAVYFPIQMAVVLSPRAAADAAMDGFQGGEFLLHDVPKRDKSQRRSVPGGLGDALLFCTRDRLVRVGGTYGLQPVKHGVAPITAGERFVLGLPFHEYK